MPLGWGRLPHCNRAALLLAAGNAWDHKVLLWLVDSSPDGNLVLRWGLVAHNSVWGRQ